MLAGLLKRIAHCFGLALDSATLAGLDRLEEPLAPSDVCAAWAAVLASLEAAPAVSQQPEIGSASASGRPVHVGPDLKRMPGQVSEAGSTHEASLQHARSLQEAGEAGLSAAHNMRNALSEQGQ